MAHAHSCRLQGKHFVVPVPRTGRETIEVRIQGRGEAASMPVTRLSPEGGDYVGWSADSQQVTWAMGRALLPPAGHRQR